MDMNSSNIQRESEHSVGIGADVADINARPSLVKDKELESLERDSTCDSTTSTTDDSEHGNRRRYPQAPWWKDKHAGPNAGSTSDWSGPSPRKATSEECLAGEPFSLPPEVLTMGIAHIAACVSERAERLSKEKMKFRHYVEGALARSGAFKGCQVELVGSTSLGCDIPQSDLDIVIVTPLKDKHGHASVSLLQELRVCLKNLPAASTLKRLELRGATRVPLLVLTDADGLSCDVSVDQCHALGHRDLLRDSLLRHPAYCGLIRIVKLWARRRGLPSAAEGGIPSMAWAVIALRLAEEFPGKNPSVEDLLFNFFKKMRRLRSESLLVRHVMNGAKLEFRPLAPDAWKAESIRFLRVDDPLWAMGLNPSDANSCVGQPSPHSEITPASVPTALAALYVAEIELAWKAVQKQQWGKLLWPASAKDKSGLPVYVDKAETPFQMFMKSGRCHVGVLAGVRPSKRSQQQDGIHRKDQETDLLLQPCSLEKCGGKWTATELDAQPISLRPSHWVCALAVSDSNDFSGTGVQRLKEIRNLVNEAEAGVEAVHVGMFQPPCRPDAAQIRAQASMNSSFGGAMGAASNFCGLPNNQNGPYGAGVMQPMGMPMQPMMMMVPMMQPMMPMMPMMTPAPGRCQPIFFPPGPANSSGPADDPWASLLEQRSKGKGKGMGKGMGKGNGKGRAKRGGSQKDKSDKVRVID